MFRHCRGLPGGEGGGIAPVHTLVSSWRIPLPFVVQHRFDHSRCRGPPLTLGNGRRAGCLTWRRRWMREQVLPWRHSKLLECDMCAHRIAASGQTSKYGDVRCRRAPPFPSKEPLMTLRTLILATSAFVVSAGFAASGADAATSQARRHAAMAHHGAAKHTAMRHGAMGGRMSRGGDAQNSAVDQLNAQSLATARGGAAPAGAAPAMAPAAAPQ